MSAIEQGTAQWRRGPRVDPHAGETEWEAVVALRDGCPTTFAALVERHQHMMLRVASDTWPTAPPPRTWCRRRGWRWVGGSDASAVDAR